MPELITVGIAGATGYAGQELIRLAARHPGIRITAAMGSGTAEGNRHLPALSRVWDGEITPLSIEQLAAKADAATELGEKQKTINIMSNLATIAAAGGYTALNVCLIQMAKRTRTIVPTEYPLAIKEVPNNLVSIVYFHP